MSIIFPGNFVAQLNAYRGQGVVSIPGVEFYSYIGVASLNASAAAGATYDLQILSPDLRADDKARTDKPFVIPTGAGIYRSAVNVVNLSSGNAKTITATGITGGAVLTSAADGTFAANGSVTPFAGLTDAAGSAVITRLASDTTVTAVANDGLTIVNADDQAAIIVEIDFFMDASAPGADDVSLPFKVEAGQGT